MRAAAAIVGVAFATALLGASGAKAGCERYPTVAEEFAEADYVFIARVTAGRMDWSTTEPGEFDGIEYTVQPLKAFKGEPPAELLLYSENSGGRFPMMVGGWYVLFVGQPYEMGFASPGRRERAISTCGHSFALNAVPLALEAYPDDLTFEQVMALEPAAQ